MNDSLNSFIAEFKQIAPNYQWLIYCGLLRTNTPPGQPLSQCYCPLEVVYIQRHGSLPMRISGVISALKLFPDLSADNITIILDSADNEGKNRYPQLRQAFLEATNLNSSN